VKNFAAANQTNMRIPYTSVFLELECGFWNADAEKQLRIAMRSKTGSRQTARQAHNTGQSLQKLSFKNEHLYFRSLVASIETVPDPGSRLGM
jgi:hypothetical protein